jgi:non-ribosomal peptide synthetase component E (peptide arylation enzyme)
MSFQFYHIFGNTASMNCSLWRGCNVVVLPSFVPDVFCSSIEKYQIQTIQIVPPIALYLAKAADTTKYDFSSLKILHCGAAQFSAIQQKEVQDKFLHVVMKQVSLTHLIFMHHCFCHRIIKRKKREAILLS